MAGKTFSKNFSDENLLPEGTFAVQLSAETREAFELVPNWDLSELEPQKVIQLDKIREDLQLKGETSDFFPLAAQIQVSGGNCWELFTEISGT